jgi:hypothetical protein
MSKYEVILGPVAHRNNIMQMRNMVNSEEVRNSEFVCRFLNTLQRHILSRFCFWYSLLYTITNLSFVFKIKITFFSWKFFFLISESSDCYKGSVVVNTWAINERQDEASKTTFFFILSALMRVWKNIRIFSYGNAVILMGPASSS